MSSEITDFESEVLSELKRFSEKPTRERKKASRKANEASGENAIVTRDDFVAYMPTHGYIFKPTREMWPASSVNAHVPPIGKTPASAWLDVNRPVVQMTWAPGEPPEIQNRIISEGGWIERSGVSVFNLYRPPTIMAKPGDATPWLDHIRRVFREDAEHIVAWLAHRVQRPQEKINHALVLGGAQGIGKDTLLARISHTTECIRAANQRKSLCCNIFSSIRGAPRCRQSVARICLDLHPLKDAKW